MDASSPARKEQRPRNARKSWQHFEHFRTAMARTGRYEKEALHKAGVVANRPRVQLKSNLPVRAKTRRQTITSDDLAHYSTQVILKLCDELEIAPTRVIYALASGDLRHEQNCDFSPSLLGQKAWLEEGTGE
jgi:hypothetical protein